MLQIASLTKSYGEQLALEDVGFSLQAGEILGLIGPNGAARRHCLKRLPDFSPSSQARFASAISRCQRFRKDTDDDDWVD